MTKLKIGDRVAVYETCKRYTGTIEDVSPVAPHHTVRVYFDQPSEDGNSQRGYVHPKQCRRLKPKAKPREWLMHAQTYTIYDVSHPDANDTDRFIRVREVRGKR
jgi:hypothetical protein